MFLKSDVQDAYSLSPMQEGILFHYLMEKESGAYFEQLTITVSGDLRLNLVEISLNKLIEKYDILRTIYLYEKVKKIRQVVLKKRTSQVAYTDISHLDKTARERFIEEFKETDKRKGFELIKDIPMRITVIKDAPEMYYIIWSFHHICMDGWSIPLVIKDFLDFYSSLRLTGEVKLTSVRPFADYIKWLHNQNEEEAKRFWREYLKELAAQSPLPRSKTGVPGDELVLQTHDFYLEEDLTVPLLKIIKDNNSTINSLFQAVWSLLLQRYNHQNDALFGAVVSGRPTEIKGIEDMIGVFINTLPVRIKTTGTTPFLELLHDVLEKALQARNYEYLPLSDILTNSSLKEDFIDHIMIFENYPLQEQVKDASSRERFGFDILDMHIFNRTNYDLNIIVAPEVSRIHIQFLYNSPTYDNDYMQHAALHFKHLMAQIANNPNIRIADLEIVSAEEKKEILDFCNLYQNVMTTPKGQLLHHRFETQVLKNPEKEAIILEDTTITYRRLNDLANQICYRLKDDIHAGDVVIVDATDLIELAAGVIGVLKAGGIFFPINHYFPPSYRDYAWHIGTAKYLLTDKRAQDVYAFNGTVITFDSLKEQALPQNWVNPKEITPNFDAIATLLFSAKITIYPLPVALSHAHLLNWLDYNIEKLAVDFAETLFCADSLSDTLFPLWLANLITGTSVQFARCSRTIDQQDWHTLLNSRNFTSLVAPLGLLERYDGAIFPATLSHILSVGDEPWKIVHNYQKMLEKGVKWYDYMGFPEVTMIAIPEEKTAEVRLCGNHHVLLWDQFGHVVPKGVYGELCLAGTGVMNGYYGTEIPGDHYLNKEATRSAENIFKTQYKGFWTKTTTETIIKVSGHLDKQITINGYSIHMDSVEAAILKHSHVDDCAVLVRSDGSGNTWLAAFVSSSENVHPDELYDSLQHYLPVDLFAIGFIYLSVIPRASDGRIDRKYLEQSHFIDTYQARLLTRQISEKTGVAEVAILTKEKYEKVPPLHLKDYYSFKKVTSSPEADDATSEKHSREGADNRTDQSIPQAIIQGKELVLETGEPHTLTEALIRAVRVSPDKGIVYINSEGNDYYQSYPDLLKEAQMVLAGLRKKGAKPGDKVILLMDSNEGYVAAFWGCELGGFVPVPLMLPKSWNKPSNESNILYNVWELIKRPLVITSRKVAPLLNAMFKEIQVATIEELKEYPPDSNYHQGDTNDVAIILFTSGSTGIPKGVQQTHHNILRREKGTSLHNGHSIKDVSLNWMPLEHVGGVVMFHLRDIWNCCSQLQVRVDYILTDPLRWLEIINKYRVSITWAPNFAFGLLNDKVEASEDTTHNWDLSCMRFILNGGEAINAATAKKFLKLLAPYGLKADTMKPAWGMSETCSGVAYSHNFGPNPGEGEWVLDKHSLSGQVKETSPSAGGEYITFTQLGGTIPGVNLRIVDSANNLLKEGFIGHLQISGTTVTVGYFENPQLNEEVFTPDGWFDTGDLGLILNGCMTITGRAKDVIIVNGINFNSVEIEATIETVEGVETSYTAACSIREEQSDTDKIIIFYNSQFTDFTSKLNQIKKIHRTFGEAFGLNLDYVIPVEKDDIPKTSIGKIQRVKLGKLFQAGHFDHIVKAIDIGLENEHTIPSWFYLHTWIQQQLPVNAIPPKGNTCLLFEDEDGLSRLLANQLEQQHSNAIRVTYGETFQKLSAQHYQIKRNDARTYHLLLDDLIGNHMAVQDIFYLPNYGPLRDATVSEANDIALYGLLYLVQALEGKFAGSLRLFVVSSNTQLIDGDHAVDYQKCSIIGFLKSIVLELPWLLVSHIDFDRENKARDVLAIMSEWSYIKMSREVVYRHGVRFIPSLQHAHLESFETNPPTHLPLRKQGIYLVTGGLGGIGIHLCKWLLDHFQARLIIVGRTVIPEKTHWEEILKKKSLHANRLNAYLTLQAYGDDFIYRAGDIADISFLNAAMQEGESRWGEPIAGIFHLAGYGNLEYHWTVMDRHWVLKETTQTYEDMFQTKMYGTLALHQLLKNRMDALFVAFSSTTGFFGASTFSAYAAANSFLDGFCQSRRLNGYLNTYCIVWSSWDDVGMSANNPTHMVKAMQAGGYEMIPIERGMISLYITLNSSYRRLIVGVNGSKHKIRHLLKSSSPEKQSVKVFYSSVKVDGGAETLFREAVTSIIDVAHKKGIWVELYPLAEMPFNDKGIDYRQLEEVDYGLLEASNESDMPTSETEKTLASIWQELLGKSQVSRNDNFFELGGHSLRATALVARIHKYLNVKLPLTEIFIRPTIRELAEYIDVCNQESFVAIKPAEEKAYYVLSSGQRRLYILQQMDLYGTTYNIPQAMILEGEVDVNKFETIFKNVIKRHESLRTSFNIVNDEPFQCIHEAVDFTIEYLDLVSQDDGGAEYTSMDEIIAQCIRPFDLSIAPLLRVSMIKQDKNSFILVVDMHHIISDGVSHSILIHDFMYFYQNLEAKLKPLRIQYKDFSEWQNAEKNTESFTSQVKYWQDQFADSVPVIDLPTDFARPIVQSFEGHCLKFTLSTDDTAALKQLAAKEGVTLFMLLLSLFDIFLYKLTGQQDIVTGSVVAGRRHADLDSIIGMFVNTLVFRNFPTPTKSFFSFLKEVKEKTVKTFENQDCQYGDLVDILVKDRDVSRNPLFDVMFALQNVEMGEATISDIVFKPYPYEKRTAKFDLMLQGIEAGDYLLFEFEYCTKLFRLETIQRFSEYFKKVISCVLANPRQTLTDIEIISEEEKKQILVDFNNTRTDYPAQKTIDELFAEQVRKNPDKIAIVCKDQVMTYQLLHQRAERLAIFLTARGITPDEIIGIMAYRSPEMVIGILGILKAGGAYLPIDANFPEVRRNLVLKDGNVRFLLSDSFDDLMCSAEVIPLKSPSIFEGDGLPARVHGADHLAYIIYTSGSTGKPKGVMVQHRCVVRLVKNNRFITLNERDRILQTGALAFDASTFEIWGALLNGLQLHLSDLEVLLSGESLKSILWAHDITTMWMTAPLFNQMLDSDMEIFAKLKNLLVGGDVLSHIHINRVRHQYPQLNVINGYGPTENTTFSTTFLVDTDYFKSIPIGKPISNSFAYIVDFGNKCVPIGVPGELLVGGDGVARGYLNNPELTNEKFIDNPFLKGDRLYKTGDLARWLPDGYIEFLGRIDRQIKLRGFRVEMGEIEAQILNHPDIRDVAVSLLGEKEAKFLCAYYVANQEIHTSELHAFLAKELPEYMIPAHFVHMTKLPLTPNGKVDTKALPYPELSLATEEYIAPESETEKIISQVWAEVLNLDKVGVHANFFEIGGNSINIIMVKNKLKNQLNREIPVVDLFTYPTISLLAGYLDEPQKEQETLEEKRKEDLDRGKNKLKQMKKMHKK